MAAALHDGDVSILRCSDGLAREPVILAYGLETERPTFRAGVSELRAAVQVLGFDLDGARWRGRRWSSRRCRRVGDTHAVLGVVAGIALHALARGLFTSALADVAVLTRAG